MGSNDFTLNLLLSVHNLHGVLQTRKHSRNYILQSQSHSYFSWSVILSEDNKTHNWRNARKKEIKGIFFHLSFGAIAPV